MGRADFLEKTLMLGKTEGQRRRGWQGIRWADSITNSVDMNLSKQTTKVKNYRAKESRESLKREHLLKIYQSTNRIL